MGCALTLLGSHTRTRVYFELPVFVEQGLSGQLALQVVCVETGWNSGQSPRDVSARGSGKCSSSNPQIRESLVL
jgi:hypothetical protein